MGLLRTFGARVVCASSVMDALNRTIKALMNAVVEVWVVISLSRSSVEWCDGIIASHRLMG